MKQYNRYFRLQSAVAILLVAFLGLSLTACQTQSSYDTQLQTAIPMTSSALSADVKLVASAVAYRMKGFDLNRIPSVQFAPGADVNLQEAGFNYEGFVVKGISVLGYGGRPDQRPGTELGAVILFEDTVGRRVAVRLLAHYAVSQGVVRLDHASVTPIFPTHPKMEAYIVPRADLPANPTNLIRNHADLYTFAATHAVRPGGAASSDRNLVFLFTMDRTSPTAVLKGKVSAKLINNSGYEDSTKILNYAGWRVAAISGRFNVNANSMLFAKAVYTPGEEVSFFERGNRLLGSFGLTSRALTWGLGQTTGQRQPTRPGSQPVPQAVAQPAMQPDAPPTLAVPAPPTPQTAKPVAAKPVAVQPATTQQWGPTMRPPTTKQQASKSAPTPAPPSALDQTVRSSGMISNGLVLLNLDSVEDARQVKLRLAELGYFDGSVAGGWTPQAQAALLRFTQSVQLKTPGVWDVETQMVLFAGSRK